MGSGKKFRINWMDRYFGLGISIIPNGEHRLSIHIELIKVSVYIGFGKGYDER